MAVRGVEVERRGAVGWIILEDYQSTVEAGFADPEGFVPTPIALPNALDELRFDKSVRVIVITGRNDGEFYRVSRREHYDVPEHAARLNPLKNPALAAYSATPRRNIQETLAMMEKPVIARLNGDAIGLGQAVLWGCDMIVAREDAVVSDVHTGQGEVVDSAGEHRGFPWSVTPGDGAMAFLPLYMPPTKLKEFMFVSRVWTARKLADMNIVNYAVPADQLDAVLDEILGKLLARPAHVLAHTKRVCNKHMVQQWMAAQDLAVSYELQDWWINGASGAMG
jgi:enoyl-CoA hydratase